MAATESVNILRQLHGHSALLALLHTKPDSFADQIVQTQQALSAMAHALISRGEEEKILPAIGPMLLSSLLPLLPQESELALYLKTLSRLEPEQKTPSIEELVPHFDRIVILLGRKASGKGTISQILAEDYGMTGVATSDWLRAIAYVRGYPEPFNPVMLRGLGDELRQEFGGDVLVWLTLQEFNLKGQNIAAFDGLRSTVEMEHLVGKPNVSCIWMDASDEKRLERVKSRSRPGDPKTIEELLAVDAKSFPEADALKGICQFTITNEEDDMATLRSKVDRLMEGINLKKTEIVGA